MTPPFVHLHCHSEYSLRDGLPSPKALVKAVTALGMPAVAVTDQMNLFAAVKFYKAALEAGIKPVIGADLWLKNPEDAAQPFRFVLLVQNLAGYRNLNLLLSQGYREGQHLGVPMIQWDWLANHCEGLIALSGGREGDVGRALLANRHELAEKRLSNWQTCFPDRYYLELVRTGRPDEETYLHAAVTLASRREVPLVATNDVRFFKASDFEAHEVRVCIQEGQILIDPHRPRPYSEEQYLRSPAEMAALFADIPEALDNSLEIARRCSLPLTLGRAFLPDFPTPAGEPLADYLQNQARQGLAVRLARLAPDHASHEAYEQRLETELGVIVQMGFAGYFLIVADFIQWAKDHGVPVGPGRGSGAGSLVAYALKITDLDPLAHDLLFERFLNPERVSMPDFDIDFCMEGRDQVIDYVVRRYGREAVSQIITHGRMAAKAVIRDVGRVLGHPYGFVDKIAKLIPFDLKMTLDKALKDSPELAERYQGDEEVKDLIDRARALEGLARNAGKHAGGVVIAPGRITDFTALFYEDGGEAGGGKPVTQFDMDDVAEIGLVKFDFLGLRTLTIINWALQNLNPRRCREGLEPLDISAIPMDDEPTFRLLQRCETTSVFQLESRGMRELVRKLQPDCFNDITALVALFRPGPLGSGMVDDYVDRKHGRARVTYLHPALEATLKPTHGVILYQEQVMQIAQVLAGYTLGGADLLRRAMGKKKVAEMAEQRSLFVGGAMARGVESEAAGQIFDLMEHFADYGFNKSHSAAYALVAYQTAYLKAHYPAEFMAAVLSSEMDKTDRVVPVIEECRQMGLTVEQPCVNRSRYRFVVADHGTILYGLGAIKGMGEAAIQTIEQAREQGGPFQNLFDFCSRVDLRKANKRVLEALIQAGALDSLGRHRAHWMHNLALAIKFAEQKAVTLAQGQTDLFGGLEETPATLTLPEVLDCEAWDEAERLVGEKATLGLYLTGHPINPFEADLSELGCQRIGTLAFSPDPAGDEAPLRRRRTEADTRVAGLVVTMRHNQTQRGRMANVTLDDRTGRLEVTCFSEVFAQAKDLLVLDRLLVIDGVLGHDDFRGGLGLTALRVQTLEEARIERAKTLTLRLSRQHCESRGGRWLAEGIREILQDYRQDGACQVVIDYRRPDCAGTLLLGVPWRIRPDENLLRALRRRLGAETVSLGYSHLPSAP
ncbi:MAG: DNA polymerase III subunit alpha [Pseudomonadota bacterium]